MFHSSDPEFGLTILKAKQILSLLNKIYVRLAYGTRQEKEIADSYIKPAYNELKEYWNMNE